MLSRAMRSLYARSRHYIGQAYRATQVSCDAIRATQKLGPTARGLFIDCGSNLGQGLRFFISFYRPNRFDYILIEPNPNCIPILTDMIETRQLTRCARLIPKAAWIAEGSMQLYGIGTGAKRMSEGASLISAHNEAYCDSSTGGVIEVESFSLSNLILREAAQYETIALKLDVEGAEYDILRQLIDTKAVEKIAYAYVEFHSYCLTGQRRVQREIEEKALRELIREAGVSLTAWH